MFFKCMFSENVTNSHERKRDSKLNSLPPEAATIEFAVVHIIAPPSIAAAGVLTSVHVTIAWENNIDQVATYYTHCTMKH